MTGATADAAPRMDRIYRFQRHIYDFTRKPYLLGRDRLIEELCVPADGKVLEIACGTGRNLVHAARRYPQASFFGFDVSEAMLATAAASIEIAKLRRRIALAHADATTFDADRIFGQPVFDRIIISYALSMIPSWHQVLPLAIDLLPPGGSLHIVDFGQQAGMPRWFRSALFAWLARFLATPRTDLLWVLECLAGENAMNLHFESLYRGYAYYAVLERR